jgi:ABC-type branched-subunit amino acid transport system ATPase component/ABC-type branched-subunit amino acid transport system permease subunit
VKLTRWKRPVIAIGLSALAVLVLPPLGGTEILRGDRAFDAGLGLCYAMMALSLNLLLGYAGQISLGHGAFVGIGAFASGLLMTRGLHLPFPFAVLGAGVVGGAFALALGFPALRLRGLYLAIVTVAFAIAIEESLFKWSPISRGNAGVELPRPKIGSLLLTKNADYLVIVVIALILFWLVDQNVVRTKVGRAFHAIRSDESVAQAFGVDVTRFKLLAFVLSGGLAAIAGSLAGHLVGLVDSHSYSFYPPESFSILLVVMVVIGGLGSRVGVAVSAALYAILPLLFTWTQEWQLIVGAALLIYTVARHPTGIAGAIREARGRKAEKAARRASDDEEDASLPKLPAMPRPAGLPERSPAATDRLLEVQDVSVRFGGLQALQEVSFSVPRGKIVGLIGPNGAGKTTLFNVISGFVKAERGSVRFDGREIIDLPPFRRVGMGIGRTFQLIGLAKDLSVHENFLLAQHVVAGYSVPSGLAALPSSARVERELRDRARNAITSLGFEEYTDTPVRNLSHGQQRIVELGCSLVTAPDLLLLDEPSAGMSPAAAESLAQRLREIRDELGRTILLIEHHIPLVMDVCDEICVLNFGQVLSTGTTEELAARPEVVGAYLGEAVPA